MTSVRSRLALALALVLILPALAAGIAVGVRAPEQARKADARVVQSVAGSVATLLAQQCATLGESASGLALLAGGPGFEQAATTTVSRLPGAFVAFVRGDEVQTKVGPVPSDRGAELATGGCSQTPVNVQAPAAATGPPVIREVVRADDAQGAELGAVVVGRVLSAGTLGELRRQLGVAETIELGLACPGGRGVSTARDAGTADILRQRAAARGGASSVGDWQIATATADERGEVCAVSAATESESPLGSSLAVAGLLIGGTLVSLLRQPHPPDPGTDRGGRARRQG
jgi:hypothetical protein